MSASGSVAERLRRPRIGLRFLLMTLIGGVLLCWPTLLSGDLFYFRDTASYVRGGRIVLAMVEDKLDHLIGGASVAVEGASPDPGPPVEKAADFVRSFVYSIVAYLAVIASGPLLLAFLQGAMTTAAILLVLERSVFRRPALLAAGAVVLAAATPLAIYSSFLVPDIFSGLVMVHAILLIARFDRVGTGVRWLSTAIACFAVATHYGNPPMAAALYLPILVYLYLRRRLGWAVVIAAVLPVMMAPVANLTASTVALETPSVTPMRYPILLARSIGDGPASWYLQEACPGADLAFCRLFPHIPESTHEFLWDVDGISRLTERQMQEIRDEELLILWRTFQEYPVEQFDALFGNAVRQVFLVGTSDINSVERLNDVYEGEPMGAEPGAALLEFYDRVLPWTSLGFALMLVLLLWLRRRRGDRVRRSVEALVVVVAGLLVNAAIFGGLSAPVDRYQARLIWIVALLALLELARLMRPRWFPER